MNAKRVEKIIKGISNHNRIKILAELEKKPDITVYDIAERIRTDYKNASQHTLRLVNSGLIFKKYNGQFVQHKLTDRGREALRFCRMIK